MIDEHDVRTADQHAHDWPRCPGCGGTMQPAPDEPDYFVCESEECDDAGLPLTRRDVEVITENENERRGVLRDQYRMDPESVSQIS